MFYTAKFIEAFGICMLTLGLIIGLSTQDTRTELTYLAVGGVIFTIGWMLEPRAKDEGETSG